MKWQLMKFVSIPVSCKEGLVWDYEIVFRAGRNEPEFEFEPVDTSLIPPRPRKYDAAK
jgi:hypothetical protein